MKKSSLKYIEACKSLTKFTDVVKYEFSNININNEEFIKDLFNYVSSFNIKGLVSFRNACSIFFKERRNNKSASNLSKEYWYSMGWSLDEAKEKIYSLQKDRSHLTINYWLNKGFSNDEAVNKIKKIQSENSNKRYSKYTKEEISNQSVWSKQYWLNKGLNEHEANLEVSKRNYAHREFWNSDKEYEEIKKIIGKKTSKFIKENPEIYSSFFGSVSKEEISFFNKLKKVNPNIIHKEFIINVKNSDELNQGLIKYDGYIKTINGIILIEYDGLYWHNQSYDEIKDSVSISLRSDILGIIRVSCERYKTNKDKTIKKINNAIREIKNKEGNRIKIY